MKNLISTTILNKTMADMPRVFTSYQFKNVAISNGIDPEAAKMWRCYPFLRKFADNECKKGKTWTKREVTEQLTLTTINDPLTLSSQLKLTNLNDESLNKAIQIVKTAGYKIMKPVKDWVEL